MVLHQGGQCGWAGGMKGWLVRSQQPRSKRISFKGQGGLYMPISSYCSTWRLAFTPHWCTSQLCCVSRSSSYPPPPFNPTLLQYYCTTIAQYIPPTPTPPLHAIHNTILAMAITCKGQPGVSSPTAPPAIRHTAIRMPSPVTYLPPHHHHTIIII